MYELIYTSAPRGLLQGRSGFCTVAMTTGFPPNLIPVMENMSGYHCLYPPGHPEAKHNPVNCVYQQILPGGNPLYAVSRIEYSGLSYTGRSNILAHHYIFTPRDLEETPFSPADILRCPDNFPPWGGAPRYISKSSLPKQAPPLPGDRAENWEKWAGSAEWAAIAAALFREKKNRFLALGFPPEVTWQDLLELTAEVCRLLTPEEQLRFSFSTYCCQNLIGSSLFLRAYPEDSVQLESIRSLRQAPVVMLGRENPVPPEFRTLSEQKIPDIRIEQEADMPPACPVSCIPEEYTDDPPVPAVPNAAPPAEMPEREKTVPPHQQPAEEEPELEDSWKPKLYKLLFFALLALTMTGFVLLFRFLPVRQKAEPPEKTVLTAGPQKTVPEPQKTVPEPQKTVPEPQKPVRTAPEKKAPAPKTVQPVRKTAPVSGKKTSPPAPRTVTPDEMLDFHLALQNGKTVIPLPSPWASAALRNVTIRGVRDCDIPKEKLAVFVRKDKDGQIRILDVRSSEIDGNPEPVERSALMTLKLSGGCLRIAHAEGSDPQKNIRNIDSILFGNGQTYTNLPPGKWTETAIRRYGISGKLDRKGKITVSWEYRYGTEPLTKEIRDLLEAVVMVDSKVVQRTDLTPDNANTAELDIPSMQNILSDVARLTKAVGEREEVESRIIIPRRPSLESIRKHIQTEKKKKKQGQKKNSKKWKEYEEDLRKLDSKEFFEDMNEVFSAEDRKYWDTPSDPASPAEQKKIHAILGKLEDYGTEPDPDKIPRVQFLQSVRQAAGKYEQELRIYQKLVMEQKRKVRGCSSIQQQLLNREFAKEIFKAGDFKNRRSDEMKEHLKEKTVQWFKGHISVKIMKKKGAANK